MANATIRMSHGSGKGNQELLEAVVFPALHPGGVGTLEDAFIFDIPGRRFAFSTDSFVVSPLEFPGGDIGKLAACGTINDLSMMAAKPILLSVSLILEEGLELSLLSKMLKSLYAVCASQGVRIACGDTKVVEKGKADRMFINTAGIGIVRVGISLSAANARPGDAVIVSGGIGLHGITVLSQRANLGFASSAVSDCAPLFALSDALLSAVPLTRTLRDATRGGLAAVVYEIAQASKACIVIKRSRPCPCRRWCAARAHFSAWTLCILQTKAGLSPLFLRSPPTPQLPRCAPIPKAGTPASSASSPGPENSRPCSPHPSAEPGPWKCRRANFCPESVSKITKENRAVLPVVSIVGRPNVGKSSLFNRILGKKVAVVDDMPGVTRDRNYRPMVWNGCAFSLADTGGLIPSSTDGMAADVERQVNIACREAGVILFVVDARDGITDIDRRVAHSLRKQGKDNVVLVVNKSEHKAAPYDLGSFVALGLGEGHPVSALHGYGVGDMLDAVCSALKRTGNKEPKSSAFIDDRDALKVAVVGRPNAGKSSLVNKLLGASRMIVRPDPGTTRDSIDSRLVYKGSDVVLIDTAGLRKKANVKEDLEYYCNLRAIDSIGRCDIAALVVDATLGIHEQDLRIVRKIRDLHKGVLVCWNKWDIVRQDAHDLRPSCGAHAQGQHGARARAHGLDLGGHGPARHGRARQGPRHPAPHADARRRGKASRPCTGMDHRPSAPDKREQAHRGGLVRPGKRAVPAVPRGVHKPAQRRGVV